MLYNVKVNFQGYVRGSYTHQVEAESEEEALSKVPRYINESTIDLTRQDVETTDVYINE